MKISAVSIDRPVFAIVCSLIIVLAGGIAYQGLSLREFPDVDSPTVTITTVFPGAAPEVVENSVTQPIEDEVIGIEGIKHVTSKSREQVSSITVEFELSRDIDAAANDVRDRVARARRHLPDEVEAPVVSKRSATSDTVLWLALSGEGYDQVQLTSILEQQVKDRLAKLSGVAFVIVGGERRYSMRVWVDSDQLTARGLTVADIASALERENVDIPSGRLEGEEHEFTVRSLGELHTVEEYERLPVANIKGQIIFLRDVARVEVGPEDERKVVHVDGVPTVAMGIVKQSKANLLDVADAVKAEAVLIREELPPGVMLKQGYDAAKFVRKSISDVAKTILEALVFVVIVIFFFLGSLRATLIPALAIPVSLIGSLAAMRAFGFSINTLTLMGLTLAIGLVVDDAIVVLENITRRIDLGESPREAASKGMQEISMAVIAATVSVVAAFVPLALMSDRTGRLFREFGVTVAVAVAISGFVSLTLCPALCARILRPKNDESSGVLRRVGDMIQRLMSGYTERVARVLQRPWPWVALGVAWFALGGILVTQIDQELIGPSDRDMLFAYTQAPHGSTIDYTARYQAQVEQAFLDQPEMDRVMSVVALGIGTPGMVNEGFVFAMLQPRDERERSAEEIKSALFSRLWDIPGVQAFPMNPPPLTSIMSSAPVSITIQGDDLGELSRYADLMIQEMREIPGFQAVRTDFNMSKPQVDVKIDRDRASDLGVSVRDIATALQTLLGGADLSTFKLHGETYKVIVQLESRYRAAPSDVKGVYVRGAGDELVSLASLVSTRETTAPQAVLHFDRLRSATVEARLTENVSQGEAITKALAVAEKVVPPSSGYRYRLTRASANFVEAGNALVYAYMLALLIVYLVLAAQFESFAHPFTILVAVAFSFTGALVALTVFGVALSIYSKIGLVMLIGLVTKNSILIVEFANQLRARGKPLREAILEASATRFRPILMTAMSTIVGMMPIALALGAGGESRAPLGIAVVGGMVFSTLLTIFIVPAVYLLVEGTRERFGVGKELA
ncbi:MAG: efflux RND transporter permease subunit [Deltaproteobacteria bacterium]|nr:efflux RND transporter permease subunit [Deltaproteobacteria bacterium]